MAWLRSTWIPNCNTFITKACQTQLHWGITDVSSLQVGGYEQLCLDVSAPTSGIYLFIYILIYTRIFPFSYIKFTILKKTKITLQWYE